MIYTKGYDVHARGVVLTYYNLTNFIDQLKGGHIYYVQRHLAQLLFRRHTSCAKDRCRIRHVGLYNCSCFTIATSLEGTSGIRYTYSGGGNDTLFDGFWFGNRPLVFEGTGGSASRCSVSNAFSKDRIALVRIFRKFREEASCGFILSIVSLGTVR
jgi:hypothetical protein